jgi:hypothetical protein
MRREHRPVGAVIAGAVVERDMTSDNTSRDGGHRKVAM